MKIFKKRFLIALMVLVLSLGVPSYSHAASLPNVDIVSKKVEGVDEATKARVEEAYGKLPLYFIQNAGQVDKRVKFYEKGSDHTTFFTKEGVYLLLVKSEESSVRSHRPAPESQAKNPQPRTLNTEFIKLTLPGASKATEIVAEGLQKGKVNYFIGNNPEKWKTNIPTYKAVIYKEVYKGIDIKFYGNNRQLEYDVVVKQGADLSLVRFSYDGIEGLRITDEGDLEIALKEGKVIQKKPYIYQEIYGERVEVDGRFRIQDPILETEDQKQFVYGFVVASYDKGHPLVIDPTLVYSTYLGGSSFDNGEGIAIDTSGNAYIAGDTVSTDFPTASPIQGAKAGWWGDAFVAKIAYLDILTPTVISVTPNKGEIGSTQDVTITGTNFEPGAKVSLLNGGPFLAGDYNTPGWADSVYVSGDYAYVADGGAGLQVIDISDPTNPILAGSYDTPDYALGVYVSGDYAFVADGDSGLQVIKINDPVINITVLDSNTITATFPAGLPEGSYHVLVTNPGGEEGILHNGFKVEADVTPPAITDLEVTDITNITAVVSWNTDESSDSVVEYGIAPGNYTDSISDPMLVTSHSLKLTDLTAETTYYFVVKSTDSNGNPAQSDEHNFTKAIPGDLDGDKDVDDDDYTIFRTAYGSCNGDDNFISAADLDDDGCITINDYRILRSLIS